MNIDDICIGEFVLVSRKPSSPERLISVNWHEEMTKTIGACFEVIMYIRDDNHVKLSNGYWYPVEILELPPTAATKKSDISVEDRLDKIRWDTAMAPERDSLIEIPRDIATLLILSYDVLKSKTFQTQ